VPKRAVSGPNRVGEGVKAPVVCLLHSFLERDQAGTHPGSRCITVLPREEALRGEREGGDAGWTIDGRAVN
jgi:hypothetical protein